MFFLEVALGQFTSEGGITCWEKLCPIFTGREETPSKSEVKLGCSLRCNCSVEAPLLRAPFRSDLVVCFSNLVSVAELLDFLLK